MKTGDVFSFILEAAIAAFVVLTLANHLKPLFPNLF
jgi:hypothetical protein